MKSKIMKEKESGTVFGKRNYIILMIGSILIIVGYIVMSGEGSTDHSLCNLMGNHISFFINIHKTA